MVNLRGVSRSRAGKRPNRSLRRGQCLGNQRLAQNRAIDLRKPPQEEASAIFVLRLASNGTRQKIQVWRVFPGQRYGLASGLLSAPGGGQGGLG
jgi:hypothetical protein